MIFIYRCANIEIKKRPRTNRDAFLTFTTNGILSFELSQMG